MESGQELKQDPEAETTEESCLLAYSLTHAQPVFLYSPGIPAWGMVLLTVDRALIQSRVETTPTDMPRGQSGLISPSMKTFFSDDSRLSN